MRRGHFLGSLLLAALVLAGCVDESSREDPGAPTEGPDPHVLARLEALAAAPEVRFETEHGTIRLLLLDSFMPTTAGRFATLVDDGFYDGTIVHRVVDDFVIQGGDPSGTGLLGSGQTIPHEVHPDLQFGGGAVGLARDVDPDSGDSQWFITERPAPHLHDPSRSTAGSAFGAFALYAQVFAGMDVVRSIAAVPVVPGADRPVEDVTLRDAQLLARPLDVDLLQYPRTLRLDPTLTVERPLQLLAGHPFELVVYLRPDPEAEPPPAVTIGYAGAAPDAEEGTERDIVLQPVPGDPWSFAGNVTLEAGSYDEVVTVDGTRASAPVEVLPWHEEYGRRLRNAPAP